MTSPAERRGRGPLPPAHARELLPMSELGVRAHAAIVGLNTGFTANPDYPRALFGALAAQYERPDRQEQVKWPSSVTIQVGPVFYTREWRATTPKHPHRFGSEDLTIIKSEAETDDQGGIVPGRRLASIMIKTSSLRDGDFDDDPLVHLSSWSNFGGSRDAFNEPLEGQAALDAIPEHFGDLLPQAAE